MPTIIEGEDFSGWASFAAFVTARYNDADGTGLFSPNNNWATDPRISFDDTDTFYGNPSLAGDYSSQICDDAIQFSTFYAATSGDFDTPIPDITQLLVFKLPVATYSTDVGEDYALRFLEMDAGLGSGGCLPTIVIDNDTVTLRILSNIYPHTVTTSPLGSVSDWGGDIRQVLMRVQCVSTTETTISVYLNAPCAAVPTLITTQTVTHDTRSVNWVDTADILNGISLAAGPADPIRLYQVGYNTDPTVFGIPA